MSTTAGPQLKKNTNNRRNAKNSRDISHPAGRQATAGTPGTATLEIAGFTASANTTGTSV
jgi:hypothetical protein